MRWVSNLLTLVIVLLPTLAWADFHQDLLARGKAYYQSGQYPQAVKALRIAAFGLLDTLEDYETAKIYLALSYDRIGDQERSREALLSVFRAEEIRRTYQGMDLPGNVRGSFEDLVTKHFPERARGVPAANPATTTQRPGAAPPVPPIPDPPEPQPLTAQAEAEPMAQPASAGEIPEQSVEIDELEGLLDQQPDSVPITLALADAHLRHGNLEEARQWATQVADRQPQNAIAKIYLARISHRESKWAEAVTHFLAADRSATLSQDDQALLLTALVSIGRYADARRVATSLDSSTLERPDVKAALETLEENFRPVPPAKAREIVPPVAVEEVPPAPIPTKAIPSALSREDVFALMREARQLESAGQCDEAVRIYLEIGSAPELERFVRLAAAQGLGVCLLYEEALEIYSQVGPLNPGEEVHMFRMAVAFYETGNLTAAKEYLKSALRALEVTPEVKKYRDKIGRQ